MLIRSSITLLFLVIIWQLIVFIFHLPRYILPGPITVLITFIDQIHIIIYQAIPTLIEIIFGLFFGILFGVFAALAVTYIQPARRFFLPILLISQSLPTFAIAPILVVWFGYGISAKIIVIIIMIFFPITSSFYDGLRQTPTAYMEMAHITGASKWKTFLLIKIPAAMPHLASGLRVAIVYAPMGAIIGEWVGASRGLGYLMQMANTRMEIALMFAVLLVIIALTLLFYFTVDFLLKKFIWWK